MSHPADFSRRHIGLNQDNELSMLKFLNLDSIDELIDRTVPESIRDLSEHISLPPALSEVQAIERLQEIASLNIVNTLSLIHISEPTTPL